MAASAASIALDGSFKDKRPPIVTFKPSMWDDTFTSHSLGEQLPQDEYREAIERLKEQTRKMLIPGGSRKIDKLILIDTLERLGLAYHFEKEIEEQIQHIYKNQYSDFDAEKGFYNDLFSVSLEFRLLRQHHYNVTCDVFANFKMKGDNKFNVALISCDAKGLLNLYEAAETRIHGEEILDDVVAFAPIHLNRMLPDLESPLQDKVGRALKQSLHRGMQIVEVRYYISMYEKDDMKDELLVKFSKLNFNFLQNLYKNELRETIRWWKEFDIMSNLDFTRDRVVEAYFWALSHHYEPQYAYVRTSITKTIQLQTVVDDTYDNYATIEEGRLFTKLLEKWDINEIDPLPENMKIVYKFMWTIFQEFEHDASERGRSYMMPHVIESMKEIGRAYMRELEWFNGRQLPAFEEYFAHTLITGGIHLFFIPCFIGIASASLEAIEWMNSTPQLFFGTTNFTRLMDDMASWERESREKMPTGVECYMKQYSVSREETFAKYRELAEVAWKDVNTGMVKASTADSIPKDIVDMYVGHTRVAGVCYKNCQDGYSFPEKTFAPLIVAVLVDPIVI